jgi:hypothetical protein
MKLLQWLSMADGTSWRPAVAIPFFDALNDMPSPSHHHRWVVCLPFPNGLFTMTTLMLINL